MMKKALLALVALPLALVSLAACAKSGDSSQAGKSNDKPLVATSFYPMYAFTKAVAGDELNVVNILPSNQDIHEFEPSAKATAQMTDAKALVYNDKDLEKWASGVQTKGLKIEAAEAIKTIESDPHTWLAPKEAITEVETIAEGLEKAFPDKKDSFEKNKTAYIKKLEKLDADYQKGLKDTKQKVIVTQHDAFSYMARDYGLKNVAVAGVDPEAEPSSATLVKLKEELQKNKVKYVYTEMNVNDKIAKSLAEGSGAKLVELNTLESITDKDSMDSETYIKIMEDNLKTLESTLNE
ncbi:metal ABC transporter solute-binding protein, Zn/Mn family [Lactococcus termiticola]|uniref:Metal ABC transporter substrate-binding protein n=1 Tax=Lactococcus termiticola TaxID=2169526 RepID=A0A2R5HGM5_9LACT|nr:zinc ABC transporter substrate-binding protein [Lactococcus termiticola]GBG96495.1 metal ABC transporter substrate-binding protein [Lactococcus termiticola]